MKNYSFFLDKPHYKEKKKIFKLEVLECDSATTIT